MSESTSTGDFPEVRCYTLNDYQALRASYDALAARLAEAERKNTELRECYNEVYRKMANLGGDVGLFRRELRDMTARAEAAEARVRELEAALGRGSIERCVQCAGHGYLLSPRRGRFECENCDEKGFVLMRDGRKVTLSAGAVQEPPADVFDAMNLPAVGFPTTGEK